jgi:hypothetical protein
LLKKQSLLKADIRKKVEKNIDKKSLSKTEGQPIFLKRDVGMG